jgi:hypothetical protein
MQVELNNMYANIGVNNSSEKLRIYLLLIPRQNTTLLIYNKALRKVKNIRQHVSVLLDHHQALGNVQS